MELIDILSEHPDLIQFDFSGSTKETVIENAVTLLDRSGLLSNKELYLEDVLKREAEYSTGIGMGIAIPHAKSEGVKKTAFTIIKLQEKVEWGSLDDQPAELVIMLAVPQEATSEFLSLLSTLSYNLMDDDFRNGIMEAQTREEIYKFFTNLKK